eukprot:872991_1
MELPLVRSNAGYSHPSNDILIQPLAYNLKWMCRCSQLPTDTIAYHYIAPTPILEKRGLTPSILRNELNIIESKAAEVMVISNMKIIKIVSVLCLIVFIVGNIIFWPDHRNTG